MARFQTDADRFGFSHKIIHLGRDFIDMVKNPEHGYGKNLNPCIDCKIMMLSRARDHMDQTGADFIITGEVVGQRPMSQMKPTLKQIEKKAGLIGKIVRPLCGKILESTIPEQQGLIKRDWLLGINGRSRTGQMKLAEKFGLTDYASPAGGCLLTDPNYSRRLQDLFDNQVEYDQNDIYLLRHGRQFRLSPNAKLVVGRDEKDNDNIEELVRPDDHVFEVMDIGSPIGLLRGKPEKSDIELAAAITARYSDAKREDSVTVDVKSKSQTNRIGIRPADDAVVTAVRM
jgi:tRNA U34 2-thiouridine synthase MnmA/TrmU